MDSKESKSENFKKCEWGGNFPLCFSFQNADTRVFRWRYIFIICWIFLVIVKIIEFCRIVLFKRLLLLKERQKAMGRSSPLWYRTKCDKYYDMRSYSQIQCSELLVFIRECNIFASKSVWRVGILNEVYSPQVFFLYGSAHE